MRDFYYSSITVYGFHGCHAATRDKLLNDGEPFRPSTNEYDWLGDGIYFWEGDLGRASEWAVQHFGSEGAVVGARIRLGFCFDLSNTFARLLLRDCYEEFAQFAAAAKVPIPRNRNPPQYVGHPDDMVLRFLDRAVLQYAVNEPLPKIFSGRTFDSVRAPFQEGIALYRGSSFRERDHIHLCIRNPACIEELFDPVL